MVGSVRALTLTSALSLVLAPLVLSLAAVFDVFLVGPPLSVAAALVVAFLVLRRRPELSSGPVWVFGAVTTLAFVGLAFATRVGVVTGAASARQVLALWLLAMGFAVPAVGRHRRYRRVLRRERRRRVADREPERESN